MCLRETHEGREGVNEHETAESLVGFEGSERIGYWFLGAKRAGTEGRQLSAIDIGFKKAAVAEDMVGGR